MARPANPPLSVVPLSGASAKRTRGPGRPANLELPPLPIEIWDGMCEIEQQMFEHFQAAYEAAFQRKYGKLSPTARINIQQAALEYIHLMRLQAEQMTSKSLVSQARQHPGVQLRAWLQAAGLQERDIEVPNKPEDERSATRAALLGLAAN